MRARPPAMWVGTETWSPRQQPEPQQVPPAAAPHVRAPLIPWLFPWQPPPFIYLSVTTTATAASVRSRSRVPFYVFKFKVKLMYTPGTFGGNVKYFKFQNVDYFLAGARCRRTGRNFRPVHPLPFDLTARSGLIFLFPNPRTQTSTSPAQNARRCWTPHPRTRGG